MNDFGAKRICPDLDATGTVVETERFPKPLSFERSLRTQKGRVVERLVGKVEQIVTKPIATEVRARFFDKGLKLPVRAVEELQGKEPGQ